MAAAQNMAMTTTQKVIAIAVTIIIISTVAIPVVEDLSDDLVIKYNNENYYFSNLIDDTTTHTIVYGSSTVVVDGVTLTSIGKVLPLVLTDTLTISPLGDFATMNIGYSGFVASGVTAANITINTANKTVYVSDIVAGSSYSDFSVAYQEFCFLAGKTGDYVSVLTTTGSQVLYVESKSDVMGLNSDWDWVYGNESYSHTGGTVSMSVNLHPVSGYSNLYTIDLDRNNSDVLITNDGTTKYPSYVVVPASVDAYKEGMESAFDLISVIPILLILIPLMLAVRMIALRRN